MLGCVYVVHYTQIIILTAVSSGRQLGTRHRGMCSKGTSATAVQGPVIPGDVPVIRRVLNAVATATKGRIVVYDSASDGQSDVSALSLYNVHVYTYHTSRSNSGRAFTSNTYQ